MKTWPQTKDPRDLGYFMPGDAFGSGADDALLARIELEYEF